MNPYSELKEEFVSIIEEAVAGLGLKVDKKEIHATLSTPKEEFGDISSSIAFRLARERKTAPHIIASELMKHLGGGKLIKEIKELDGYLNAFVDESAYAKLVIESVRSLGEKYGRSEAGKGKKVIVEYPSVNPNKPWHIGHLKNALLGDSIARILSFCSYNVEREDYIDDLGLQVAESLWGYLNLGDKPDKKFDQWLGEEYVKVNNVMKERDISSEINALLKKMEDSSTSEARLSREFAENCVKAQYETAFNYRCYHDILVWESDIVRAKLLERALEQTSKGGAIEKPSSGKYANCLVANLEKLGSIFSELKNLEESMKVLVRSNGTATYLAKDLAFHMWKFGIIKGDFLFEEFIRQPNGEMLYTTSSLGKEMPFGNADIVINVIGSAQQHEQLMLKALLAVAGYEEKAMNLVHLSYGEVELEEGSLHGRSGGWIGKGKNYTADDLLSEVKSKAMEFVKDMPSEEREKIANEVALGAIRFEFLRSSPEKKTIFSWEKALNFEANSGPYCMYTYARASKIIEKAGSANFEVDYSKLTRGYDFKLIKLLGLMPDYVEKACNELRPNIISDYLLELSSLFSKFYEAMPVLKSNAVGIRLAIVDSTRQVIKNMLLLLGITPLERI
ncbi:MAG: arginine--tRNA ligase [Candidatus Micrarchaeia archaeon]